MSITGGSSHIMRRTLATTQEGLRHTNPQQDTLQAGFKGKKLRVVTSIWQVMEGGTEVNNNYKKNLSTGSLSYIRCTVSLMH